MTCLELIKAVKVNILFIDILDSLTCCPHCDEPAYLLLTTSLIMSGCKSPEVNQCCCGNTVMDQASYSDNSPNINGALADVT